MAMPTVKAVISTDAFLNNRSSDCYLVVRAVIHVGERC